MGGALKRTNRGGAEAAERGAEEEGVSSGEAGRRPEASASKVVRTACCAAEAVLVARNHQVPSGDAPTRPLSAGTSASKVVHL